jgi:hypothetical protein
MLQHFARFELNPGSLLLGARLAEVDLRLPVAGPMLEVVGRAWEPDQSVPAPRAAVCPDLDRAAPAGEVVVR